MSDPTKIIEPILDQEVLSDIAQTAGANSQLVDILEGNLKITPPKPEELSDTVKQAQNTIDSIYPDAKFDPNFNPPVHFGLRIDNALLRTLCDRLLQKYPADRVIKIILEIDQAVEAGILDNKTIHNTFQDRDLLEHLEK